MRCALIIADGAIARSDPPRDRAFARRSGGLAAALLATSFLTSVAHAQNATWQAVPTVAGPIAATFDFNANANWTPAAVPTGTASFGATTGPNLSFSAASTVLGGFTFNAGAPAYTFQVVTACVFCTFPNLTLTGAGVVNNAASVPTFKVFLGSALTFQNASTAANSNIEMHLGSLSFQNTSTAGNAIITMPDSLHPGFITFHNNSNAGHASITVTETFGAQIPAELVFLDASNASTATIMNNPGTVLDPSQPNGGRTEFGVFGGTDTAGAGSANITNNKDGSTTFYASTSAQNATIVNNSAGSTQFRDQSTAANANITNNAGSSMFLAEQSTLGNATIANKAGATIDFGFTGLFPLFPDTATAGNAAITNDGTINFNSATTAGSATITTNNGGKVFFVEGSTGGNARFITNAGGTFDMSGLTTAGMTAGSIEGAGNYLLGAKALTVGSNNLSTEVSGVISGTGGALTKVGTGTLILTGTNTYTGGTTINGGTLQLGKFGSPGSIVGDVVDNGRLSFVGTGNVVFNGLISGTGSLSSFLSGAKLTLTADNTFSGGTSIDLGILQLGNGGATGSIGAGPVSNSGILQFNHSNLFTFGAPISGGGAVSQNGSGTTVLTAQSSYAGGTLVNAGTLKLGINNALPVGGFLGISTGAILDLATFNQTVGQLNASGSIMLGSGTLTVNGPGFSFVDGVISGTGSLNKQNSGDLLLSGDNTYTGGTTISAGTLQLGNGGTSGSIVGNVIDNGIFAINRSDAFTFGGVISGTGVFQQNGAGTTNLTATNTYTGATTVNAGTLIVNGSIASSSGLTVNAGGTVGGNGALPKTTINGGALAPGNSIGTISIGGSLTFVGAGNYIVEVSPTNSDRTNVSGAPGTASLAGTLSAVGTGGSYASGTKYTVLNAAGGVSGTFGSLAISGSFGATKPHIEYDANNVYLVLDQNALPLTGLTPNERSVATAINTALMAGSQSAPFVALFGSTAAQLPGALDQLSGEVHPSTAGALMDESLYARSAMLGRLRQASYGADSSTASLSAGGPQAFANGEELNALAYAKSPIVTKAPPMSSQPGYDVVFWAQGFGAAGKFDTDGNAAALRRDLAGFFSGVDTRVAANGRLGFAAGYTGSRNNLDGRGGSTVETGHISGYGGWGFGALNLRGGAAYAWHTIDTSRSIAFPGFFDSLTAHYNGGTGQIFGEAGYGFAFGRLALEPFAGAAFVRLNTDAFNERGGAAALAVRANSFEVGYSTFGIRAASMIPLANDMMLVPRASLAWQHAFNDVTPTDTLAFQSAGVPFVIAGVPIARDSLLGEAGLDLAIGRNATLGVSYVGQLARNVHDHAAKGKFTWKF